MSTHLHRDIDALHRDLLALSGLVEEIIDQAMLAFRERKIELGEQVIASDREIDKREVHIEEECLKILALHQPVATDLRRIATMLKVNNDLERIADLAVNIAERAINLARHDEFPIPKKLQRMVELASMMVRSSLDSLVNLDAAAARRICSLDDEVDRYNTEIIDELREFMRRDPQSVEPALDCFSVVRHVERIADHATNIAEDVLYLIDGSIARHGGPRELESLEM